MNCKVRQVPEEKLTDGDVSRRNSRIGRLSPICRQAVFACWPRELLPAALCTACSGGHIVSWIIYWWLVWCERKTLPRRHVHLGCMPQIFSPRKRETAWASGPHISIPIPIYTSKEECWSPSSSQSQCWHCELQQRGPVQARRIEGEQLAPVRSWIKHSSRDSRAEEGIQTRRPRKGWCRARACRCRPRPCGCGAASARASASTGHVEQGWCARASTATCMSCGTCSAANPAGASYRLLGRRQIPLDVRQPPRTVK